MLDTCKMCAKQPSMHFCMPAKQSCGIGVATFGGNSDSNCKYVVYYLIMKVDNSHYISYILYKLKEQNMIKDFLVYVHSCVRVCHRLRLSNQIS